MLSAVSSRVESHNNPSEVAASPVLSTGKLLYYRLFALAYGIVGRFADVVMVC